MPKNFNVTHTVVSLDRFGREISFRQSLHLYTDDPELDCRILKLVDAVIVPC